MSIWTKIIIEEETKFIILRPIFANQLTAKFGNQFNFNTTYMKKTKIYFKAFFFLLILLWGCNTPNDVTVLPKSNMRSIVSFVLNPAQNYGNVLVTHTATIDQSGKIITLKLPKDLRLDSIRPQLISSPWSTVSPRNLDYIDLRPDTVEYIVTAESGMKTVYAVVKDLSFKYSNNALLAASFPSIIDPKTGLPSRKVWASSITLPVGTSLASLNINLELTADSHNATITVSENNGPFRTFSNPVNFTGKVTFRLVSEDGTKTSTYSTTIVLAP
jgi:hypothetical protein